MAVPFLRRFLNLPTGLTAPTGSIMLGLIAVPTIVSIAEDTWAAVPQSTARLRLAVGATPWRAIWGVTLPAAIRCIDGNHAGSGQGAGRGHGGDDGGNAPVLPTSRNHNVPIRTMTATVASEMGEVAQEVSALSCVVLYWNHSVCAFAWD